MTSLKATAALERLLTSGPRFRSQPGTGGMTAVYQSVADATRGAGIPAHWPGWTAFIVLLVVVLIVGRISTHRGHGRSRRRRLVTS